MGRKNKKSKRVECPEKNSEEKIKPVKVTLPIYEEKVKPIKNILPDSEEKKDVVSSDEEEPKGVTFGQIMEIAKRNGNRRKRRYNIIAQKGIKEKGFYASGSLGKVCRTGVDFWESGVRYSFNHPKLTEIHIKRGCCYENNSISIETVPKNVITEVKGYPFTPIIDPDHKCYENDLYWDAPLECEWGHRLKFSTDAQQIADDLLNYMKAICKEYSLPREVLIDLYERLTDGRENEFFKNIIKLPIDEEDEMKYLDMYSKSSEEKCINYLLERLTVDKDIVSKYLNYVSASHTAKHMQNIITGVGYKYNYREFSDERNISIFLVINVLMANNEYEEALKYISCEDKTYFGDIRARIVEKLHNLEMGTLIGGSAEDILIQLIN